MDSYKYLSGARITKGNRIIKEVDLDSLDKETLLKAIKQKIIKKKNPFKNGSNKQSDGKGLSD